MVENYDFARELDLKMSLRKCKSKSNSDIYVRNVADSYEIKEWTRLREKKQIKAKYVLDTWWNVGRLANDKGD